MCAPGVCDSPEHRCEATREQFCECVPKKCAGSGRSGEYCAAGECPAGNECVSSLFDCTCIPKACDAPERSGSMCRTGECADPRTVCTATSFGCTCSPKKCGDRSDAEACSGGECPAGERCESRAGDGLGIACGCVKELPCNEVEAPLGSVICRGGICADAEGTPIPEAQCLANDNNKCQCVGEGCEVPVPPEKCSDGKAPWCSYGVCTFDLNGRSYENPDIQCLGGIDGTPCACFDPEPFCHSASPFGGPAGPACGGICTGSRFDGRGPGGFPLKCRNKGGYCGCVEEAPGVEPPLV